MAGNPQSANSLYQICRSLFTDLQRLIEVHAPRSLSASRKNDLHNIGLNLQAWFEEVSSIRPGDPLDFILSKSLHYVDKVRRCLASMRDVLTRIQLLLSPESRAEGSQSTDLKSWIVSLRSHYEALADEDDVLELKALHEGMQPSASTPNDMDPLPRFQPLSERGRARTDLGNPPSSSNTLGIRNLQRRTATFAIAQGQSTSLTRRPVPSPLPTIAVGRPKCEVARIKLHAIRLPVKYSHRDHVDGPPIIFPVDAVKKVLLDDEMVRHAFYCNCDRCRIDSQQESQSRHYDESSLLGKFATTFALLIYIYKAGLISHFQRHGVSLTDRPLTLESLKFIYDLKLPDDSSELAVKEIIEAQYQFHLKKFDIQHHPVILSPQEALPIEEEPEEEGHGAYGIVYSFRFLPGYAGAGYRKFEQQKFVRKIFVKSKVSSGVAEFNTLLQIYRKATSQDVNRYYEHIMEALAGYDHGNIFFIVFPYAESTLAKYLQGEGTGSSALSTPSYFWKQMIGVSGGLAFLHEPRTTNTTSNDPSPSRAFHFDLKPQNILIRNGIVMIGDFGQSKFHKASEDESSGVENERLFFNYGPPEHHHSVSSDKSEGNKSNYNYDIWSLGGIFSELITLHVSGPQGVGQYRTARRRDDMLAGKTSSAITFFIDQNTVKSVKPSVAEQHSNLRTEIENRGGPAYTASRDAWLESFTTDEFFTLINSMLSILTAENERPKASLVQTTLEALCRKAEEASRRPIVQQMSSLDLWQEARDGMFWDELPQASRQILCYITQGTPTPLRTQCVILMKPLSNHKGYMLLLWRHALFQQHNRQSIVNVNHHSPARDTGAIIDYFGHPAPEALLNSRALVGREHTQSAAPVQTLYKIIPVTSQLISGVSVQFLNAEDAFAFQASLTGQHVISDFSAPLQSGILKYSRSVKNMRPKPRIINPEALIQIWSDTDLSLTRLGSALAGGSQVNRHDFDTIPIVHVAVITRQILFLFRAEHTKMDINEADNLQGQDTIILKCKGGKLWLDEIGLRSSAVMVNIPEPANHDKLDEISFQFERVSDVALFWAALKYCQEVRKVALEQSRANSHRGNR